MSGVYLNLGDTDVAQRLMRTAATSKARDTAYAASQQSVPGANSPSSGPAVTVAISGPAVRKSTGALLVSRASEEAIAEAKRRMEEGEQVINLPLTEENKKLYDELSAEIRKCNLYTAEGAAECNQLTLMRNELTEHGWNEPLSREDLAFEVEVRNYTLGSQLLSGELEPMFAAFEASPDKYGADLEKAATEWAEQQPLPARWSEKGLNMPARPKGSAMWGLPEMAVAAGMSLEEFHAAAVDYAKTKTGAELYYSLEQLISDSNSGLSNA